MNLVVVTKGRITDAHLEKYGLKILFQKGNKCAIQAQDLKLFIEFLLKEDLIDEILHKDKYVPKEEFIQRYIDNLMELQGEMDVKYQKVFSPEGEVIGAEFFCAFPLHPFLLVKALKETCFADLKCLRSIVSKVRKKGWDKLIFFNMFPRSSEKSDFVMSVVATISASGLSDKLVLEVLEYKLEEDKVKKNISFARRQGLKVAVDDWGSENAGIFRVVNLQPDFVKIDKSITWSAEAREIIEPIVPKFQERGIKVIVEGIENEEHYNWAKNLGAYMQGFYLHKPEFF
ncbi:MAG: hypothetical protein DSZ31_01270 [Gammaproteobacteria bacterium]|nr:MAG: hypothetical protein DSZ31_01270 [Gammaproteobacteria bacterium]